MPSSPSPPGVESQDPALLDSAVDPHDEGGVRPMVAHTDVAPEGMDSAIAVLRGEGETLYELDRSDRGEWLLITDSGPALDLLEPFEAGGLHRFTVRRFNSATEREQWRAAGD